MNLVRNYQKRGPIEGKHGGGRIEVSDECREGEYGRKEKEKKRVEWAANFNVISHLLSILSAIALPCRYCSVSGNQRYIYYYEVCFYYSTVSSNVNETQFPQYLHAFHRTPRQQKLEQFVYATDFNLYYLCP